MLNDGFQQSFITNSNKLNKYSWFGSCGISRLYLIHACISSSTLTITLQCCHCESWTEEMWGNEKAKPALWAPLTPGKTDTGTTEGAGIDDGLKCHDDDKYMFIWTRRRENKLLGSLPWNQFETFSALKTFPRVQLDQQLLMAPFQPFTADLYIRQYGPWRVKGSCVNTLMGPVSETKVWS